MQPENAIEIEDKLRHPADIRNGASAALAVVCWLCAVHSGADGAPGGPMVAHWTFDENSGVARDASGNGNDATPRSPAEVTRIGGIFGNAIAFSGQHSLRTPGRPDFSKVKKITLSAWVQPTGCDQYNEIFRKEDGTNRVLFAFQESMTVLSLGLNVGGYVECDAKIAREQVLDGTWHHCAATFDGQFMRVYLDGKEIGNMSRLIAIAGSGKHNNVKVDPVSLRRLILRVDTMCPYRGSEEVRAIADPEFQGVDWLAIRPRVKTAPAPSTERGRPQARSEVRLASRLFGESQ